MTVAKKMIAAELTATGSPRASAEFYAKPGPLTFAIRNLNVLAYAQGFTLWHYKASSETLAAVCAPGTFDSAADMLATGDMVLISARDGGTVCVVTSDKNSALLSPLSAVQVAA